jgi:hypothetical protein
MTADLHSVSVVLLQREIKKIAALINRSASLDELDRAWATLCAGCGRRWRWRYIIFQAFNGLKKRDGGYLPGMPPPLTISMKGIDANGP